MSTIFIIFVFSIVLITTNGMIIIILLTTVNVICNVCTMTGPYTALLCRGGKAQL